MTTLTVDYKIKTNRKVNPATGNYQDIALRVEAKAPVITFRTAQALHTLAKVTAPQPPAKAWWYATVNPRTKKAVPPSRQYDRTGGLRDSILMLKDGKDWTVEVMADYGRFVEYGTRYMPPQPFFHNAISHAKKDVLPGLVKKWLYK